MKYIDLLVALADLGIPFDSYHVDGFKPHDTICIPERGYKCCEILYYPNEVEVIGFKCIKSYKKIEKEDLNDILELVLKTFNRCAL